MTDAAQRQEALVALLHEAESASEPIIEAFARVPRHRFLPDVPLEVAYTDDAIVTHDEGGVPTSSSSQPSLMARMLEQLAVGPGDRVLEVGAGTGYNAALLATLGAAVTTVELQAAVADAARSNLAAAGIPLADGRPVAPGSVLVVTGDGAAPPPGRYDRVIVTAGCWSLPAALVDALDDGGVIVAPLRINGVELVLGLGRTDDVLRGQGAVPCGFMPLRGGDERPWRWQLGAGGVATADADLGVEGRGAVDRLLAAPGRPVGDPLELAPDEHALSAVLWLGLQGDPVLSLVLPGHGPRPPWTLGLHVLPGSLLVIELAGRFDAVASARLHGGEAALRTCTAAMSAWRAAGAPGPAALELTIARHRDRAGWSLPFPGNDGAVTMVRGAHRWTLRYVGA